VNTVSVAGIASRPTKPGTGTNARASNLLTAPANGGPISARELGPLVDGATPQHSVQADCWQAARCLGDYTLVGCSVGPGFDFADFTLLAALPENERPPLTPVGLLAEFL